MKGDLTYGLQYTKIFDQLDRAMRVMRIVWDILSFKISGEQCASVFTDVALVEDDSGSDFAVLLSYRAQYGVEDETPVSRRFYIPRRGGYVRENGEQVCTGLRGRGLTLEATPATPALIIAALRRDDSAKRERNVEE